MFPGDRRLLGEDLIDSSLIDTGALMVPIGERILALRPAKRTA